MQDIDLPPQPRRPLGARDKGPWVAFALNSTSSSSSRNKVLVQPTWNHFACRNAASAAKQGSSGSRSAVPTPGVACSVAAAAAALSVAASSGSLGVGVDGGRRRVHRVHAGDHQRNQIFDHHHAEGRRGRQRKN